MREILRRLLAPIARPLRRREVRQATAAWRRDADDVTARFFDLASATGKPRGLRWTGGAWSGPVRLVRERGSGTLTALVGVVVSFEPVDGGEMEGVEAAALPRDATAVFRYGRGRWETDGRVLFNMTPDEAVRHLAGQVEPVEPPDGAPLSV